GLFFFFNDTATTEIYTLSLHDAFPICPSSVATSPRWSDISGSIARQKPSSPVGLVVPLLHDKWISDLAPPACVPSNSRSSGWPSPCARYTTAPAPVGTSPR